MSILEGAPASSAAGRGELLSEFRLSALLRRAIRMAQAVQSRRSVMAMRDFDDAQLADIGLRRADIQQALQLPLSSDPSHYLIRSRQNPLRGRKQF